MDRDMTSYELGFSDACVRNGLTKEAAAALYKNAQVGRGLWQILKGLANIGSGTARGVFKTTGKLPKILEFINSGTGAAGSAAAHTAFANSMRRGILSHIPGVRAFGKGYARAQNAYMDTLKNGKNPSLIGTILGLGKGSIIGNTLHGLGTFSSAHPYIGTALMATPLILASNRFARANELRGKIDTLTPEQQKIYNRTFNADGYSDLGFDSNDTSLFQAL